MAKVRLTDKATGNEYDLEVGELVPVSKTFNYMGPLVTLSEASGLDGLYIQIQGTAGMQYVSEGHKLDLQRPASCMAHDSAAALRDALNEYLGGA